MTTRTYVSVDLTIDGDWRVGAWTATDRAVLTFTTDRGLPHLPGASVRGSLRAHVRDTTSPAFAVAAFGPEAGAPDLTASPWWVLAANLLPDSWDRRERGQTGIDRVRRAPASGTQRTSETVTAIGPGPHVRIYLRCDASPTDQIVRDVLVAIGTWRPRIGGGSSVGLGRAQVVAGRTRSVDLASPVELVARLSAGNTAAGLDSLLATPTAQALKIQAPASDLLVGCDFDLPYGWAAPKPPAPVRPVMDGSTWKGLIRSRVEFIGRSLRTPVCDNSACGTCDVCAVFGSPHAASLLDFVCTSIDRGKSTGVQARGRTALSRFTNGANDQQRFDQYTEHDIRVRLEIRTLNRRRDIVAGGTSRAQVPPPWVVRAILHAIRDLAQGLVGIGGQSSIGLGTLEATSVHVGTTWRLLVEDLLAADGTLDLNRLDRLPVEAGHE